MARMEFLRSNLINTTTSVTGTSNIAGFAQFLFDRNLNFRYSTSGYTSTTVAAISWVFATPTLISQVFLQNHNLRSFQVFWNSLTTNSLLNTTTNSATSTYLSFATITVSSVDVLMNAPITADTERAVGEWAVTERFLQFDNNPTAKNYDPQANMHRIIHRMPDGGVTAFLIRDKYKTKISLDFIASSFRDNLQTMYNSTAAFYFLPEPTTTGWAGFAREVVWTNPFNFTWGESSKSQGFSGEITLEETSNA